MPDRLCGWCDAPLRSLADTGRYRDTRCRVAAFRDRERNLTHTTRWRQRALAEGWRSPRS